MAGECLFLGYSKIDLVERLGPIAFMIKASDYAA
jgi:hypothetical protein